MLSGALSNKYLGATLGGHISAIAQCGLSPIRVHQSASMGIDIHCRQLADREPKDPAQTQLPEDVESPPVADARSTEQQAGKADVQQRWVRMCAWLQPAGGGSWTAACE
jgi:secreted protein with Ig-like and vWFA domain